jgi:hypothetical protein
MTCQKSRYPGPRDTVEPDRAVLESYQERSPEINCLWSRSSPVVSKSPGTVVVMIVPSARLHDHSALAAPLQGLPTIA